MSESGHQNASGQPRAARAHVPGSHPAAIDVRISSPASLLAAVPVVLEFKPAEPSIVIVGTAPPRSVVEVLIRYDIPDPRDARALAGHAAAVLSAQGITAAYVVGYGPVELVTPVAGALRARFAAAGITVGEVLRAQDGRYWSYLCADPACCPPEGTAYSTDDHPLTRNHAGPVLASREALAATVAAVTGDAADSMREATRIAEEHAAALADEAGQHPGRRGRQRALLQPRLQAVASALDAYRAGGRLESHEDVAWVALSLNDIRVRDDAWARMDPAHRKAHITLWTDLTRLARPGYTAPAAALLAFVAWQDSNGALANVALDRALADDPEYSMAKLLRDAITAGAPPSMARLPMTPEEVAASYDTLAEGPGPEDAPAAGLAAEPA